MSDIFRVDTKDLAGAVVSAVIVAVAGYISTVADITSLDWKEIVNVAVLAAIASIGKSFGTNDKGEFLGAIKVK